MPPRGLLSLAIVAFLMALAAGCSIIADDEFASAACHQPPPDGNWQIGERQLPDVAGLHPQAAAAAFERIDLAVRWRYHYPTDPTGGAGYSECWCTAPPDGQVEDAHVSEGGWVIVFVFREFPILGGRPQPADGWGCGEPAGLGPMRA